LTAATPAFAKDIFKLLDPEGKSRDLQKAKKVLEGVGSIVASTSEIDYKSERTIGETLALEGFKRYGLPLDDPEFQKYLNLVGNSVARYSSRPNIPYYFVAVLNPLYNAFSCPGGIVFVNTQLILGMKDESQLAGVLAHEVGHVAYKHALKSVKRAKFFEGVGKLGEAAMNKEDAKEFQNMIGNLQTVLFDKGLDKEMEYEADQAALKTAYNTGYNPRGFIEVLHMLKKNEEKAAQNGSWFSTHPPLSSRIKKCETGMGKYSDANTLSRVKDRFTREKNAAVDRYNKSMKSSK
jgi:predicted Zn-dependent protease